MAAAIIPVITTLTPALVNLIASLVHHKAKDAEEIHGPGTGPVKFADVFVSVMQGLTAAHTQGTLEALPTDDIVKTIIQAVVKSMNLSGTLDNSNSTPVAGPVKTVAQSVRRITLAPGDTVTISA